VIVTDTNLFLYLFVRGSRTSEAEAVFDRDAIWLAPLLWRSEFKNALVGLVRRGDVLLEEALHLVEEAEQWMDGREYSVRSSHVLQLAERSGCSAYDCEFISVALDLQAPMVTMDKQLLKAFPTVAVHPVAFANRHA
jgi:predicted nucleic acid-binding protein